MKPISCRYCGEDIFLARTHSGYWKALDAEPVYLHKINQISRSSLGWLMNKNTRLLTPVRDIANPPAKAHNLHECDQAELFERVPNLDEPGIVKVGNSLESKLLKSEVETALEVASIKEARRARQKLTESERTNVE